MQQLISQILQILADIIINYLESLRNSLITQIITTLWLIIGGTWNAKRTALQQNISSLLTHPIYYDPEDIKNAGDKPATVYPFDIFQNMREGFDWFADQVKGLSDPVWGKLGNGIISAGFPEKILLGMTLLGFFYADIVIGYTIAYDRGYITTIPSIFQFYGIAVAFATIGSAFAAGLMGYEILREGTEIWKNKWVKRTGLFFTFILFLLSIIAAIGINAEFVLANTNFDLIVVEYIKLASEVSIQILTRVNALLATLLLPFGAAFEGLLFVIAFILSAVSVSIRVVGTILSVSLDLAIRLITVGSEVIVFLVVSAPERIVSIISERNKKEDKAEN